MAQKTGYVHIQLWSDNWYLFLQRSVSVPGKSIKYRVTSINGSVDESVNGYQLYYSEVKIRYADFKLTKKTTK